MIERMKELVRRKDICVLATVAENKPHCSLMAYVTDDECKEIYMVTGRATTKFQNIAHNPSVSLLIDTRDEHTAACRSDAQALTVSGVFEKITDDNMKRKMREKLLQNHPHIRALLEEPDAEIIRIRIISFLLLQGVSQAHFEKI